MGEVRQLTVLASHLYDTIPMITQFVEDAARAAGLDENGIFHCQMATDEACTNIIEHAYREEPDGNIEVTCEIEPGRCTIILVDYGEPFNPDTVPVPQVAGLDLDEIEPGGIGLHLMKKLMTEVEFTFDGNANRLKMVKEQSPEMSEDDPLSTYQVNGGIWVIAPKGRIDASYAPQLELALDSLLAQSPWLAIDLGRVDYVSSRGLKAIVAAWRQAENIGGNLVLAALNDRIMSVFETVGFTQVFDIYKSLDEAAAALEERKSTVG